jgi:hypothetical protein
MVMKCCSVGASPGFEGRISSQEKLSPENAVPAGDEVAGLDAYKVAVLVLVGAAILSVCLR